MDIENNLLAMNFQQIIFWTCLQHPKLVVKVLFVWGNFYCDIPKFQWLFLMRDSKEFFKKIWSRSSSMDHYFFEVKEDLGGCNPCLHHGFGTLWSLQMEFSHNNKLGSHLAPERLCRESFTQQNRSFFLTNKQSVVIAWIGNDQ